MAKIACIIMMKNEWTLLEPFLLYHQRLFGLENIYLFDNGSTDDRTREVVRRFAARGLHVDASFASHAAYANKHGIVGDLIRSLDRDGAYDFFIPLDCDEFVVLRDPDSPDGYTADPERIQAGFDRIGADEGRVLMVAENLMNIVGHPGIFRSAPYSKTIYPKGSFVETDHGYHSGVSRRAQGYRETSIAYVHFHFRGYDELVRFAREKLRMALSEEQIHDPLLLRRFRGPGFHMVGYLTGGPDSYYSQFRDLTGTVRLPGFVAHLESLGASLPFGEQSLPAETTRHLVIDRLDGTQIQGWARDRRDPRTPLAVRLLLDGQELVDLVCDEPRADVLASGYETDRVGFTVALPAGVHDGDPHVLTVQDRTGMPVLLSRHTVECESIEVGRAAFTPIDSHVDGIVDGALQGWLLDVTGDASAPSRRGGGSVAVFHDGHCLGTVTADLDRADVAGALGGDGRCGFQFPLPDGLEQATFRLFAMPGMRELHGSGYRRAGAGVAAQPAGEPLVLEHA